MNERTSEREKSKNESMKEGTNASVNQRMSEPMKERTVNKRRTKMSYFSLSCPFPKPSLL
jgi:hypothetical protein